MRNIILAVLLVVAASLPLFAQETYTQIDYPGGTNTALYGIDTAGDIVGSYEDTSGLQHGFILSSGAYTTIDYPGAANTALLNLNDNGQLVGTTNSTPYIGFSYDVATQSFTVISYPRPETVTYPFAINNAGIIAGGFYNRNGAAGFELTGITYRKILPSNASDAFVYGISNSGKLVGYGTSRKLGTRVNFLFRHGIHRPIQIPNAPDALVYGINPAGNAVVGFYKLSPEIIAGFLYQNKILTTLQFPGSNTTYASGTNAAGQVVGYFTDGINSHGFLWTPPADAAKK